MDSVQKVYDDYEDYKCLCKKMGVKPLELEPSNGWYKKFCELETKTKKDEK